MKDVAMHRQRFWPLLWLYCSSENTSFPLPHACACKLCSWKSSIARMLAHCILGTVCLMHYGDSCHQWKWQAGVKQNVLGWILIWSEFGMGRLGQHKQVTPGSPMKRRVAKHRVHHHRRTSSALTAGLGLLAEKYSALSAECLRTLRVEMQFEAIYHLQVWFLPGHVVCHVRLC
jgi:hypothetical protein